MIISNRTRSTTGLLQTHLFRSGTWKAQLRLCLGYRCLIAVGSRRPWSPAQSRAKLVGFIWATAGITQTWLAADQIAPPAIAKDASASKSNGAHGRRPIWRQKGASTLT